MVKETYINKKFSNAVFIFGFLLSMFTIYKTFSEQYYLTDPNVKPLFLLWILLFIYISFFRSRFSNSNRRFSIQMAIYISVFLVFFILYTFSLFESDYPFSKKHFPDGLNFKCNKVLSEGIPPKSIILYNILIDCDDVRIKIALGHHESRMKINYSSFPFDFSFPNSSQEGFSIEEIKINLPYMFYKFDNFSLTGSNLFSNRSTCRRFNLETGVDEVMFSGCW